MCGGVNTNRIGFKQLKVITSGGEDMVVEGAGDWNCLFFFFLANLTEVQAYLTL